MRLESNHKRVLLLRHSLALALNVTSFDGMCIWLRSIVIHLRALCPKHFYENTARVDTVQTTISLLDFNYCNSELHRHRRMGYGPLVLGRQLGRRIARRKLCAISILLLITFVLPIFLYTLLAYVIAGDPRLVPHAIRNARNILLITAHPDDECLFFSPSLLQSWGKPHVNRHLLVLSSGRLREIKLCINLHYEAI